MTRENAYSPGHPCYYKLGGRFLFPSEIRSAVQTDDYPDYMVDDILRAAKKSEPECCKKLNAIREMIKRDLRNDLRRYHECVRTIRRVRLGLEEPSTSIVSCPFIAASLKHSHIHNNFAKLMICEQYLVANQRQYSLF